MCTSNSQAGGYAGMGMQLIGGISSAFAAQRYHNSTASYLESMNDINQTMANKAIDSVQYSGGMEASRVRAKGRSMIGAQRTAMAAQGLSSGSYTYQNLLDDTTARSEMDALAIQYNADVQSQNIRNNANIQQAQYLSQAQAERSAGHTALISGLLSAGSQFADSWSKWSSTSMGNTGGPAGGNSGTFAIGSGMPASAWTGRFSTPDLYSGDNVSTWRKRSYMTLGGRW